MHERLHGQADLDQLLLGLRLGFTFARLVERHGLAEQVYHVLGVADGVVEECVISRCRLPER